MAGLSVCVPAYNSARTLATTLRSVLDQDAEFELVVLDNASTDDTGAIARSFEDPRIRVLRNDAVLPIGDNWNKVIRASRGDLVKVVCADDVLRPGALAAQLAVMADDPGITISSSRFEVIDEDGALLETELGLPDLLGRQTARALARAIVRRGPADFGPTAAAMFYRKHFDLVGGLRGDLVFPMDVDLFARVSSFGVFFGMTEILAAWRNSSFNLCSRTSTVSKLTDMYRFHHRIAGDYPNLVSRGDVLAGDTRLARAALYRLRVRTVATVRNRPDLLV
ncbi:putative glycosyltransferase [Nocardia brasiliensis NBRC 14402]|uniref:glycosyltransferase family 2 protein n=1 Tax=Nocardia brasiliensis TaxID=37326 RepID=UPI0003185AF3|nr:glycosyltransferase family 2 protein [Nocardia brasiliensis]ASF07932.1 glycosyl transferase [Nocardia brasiliensis]GAJ84772.1 putative glycosyltransferase [Nocardia brasiliensis NBRC 14402]SUB54459.1 Chondroitin polymerase [Nocardia brasiliensis]